MTMSTVPSARPAIVAAWVAGDDEARQQADLERERREPLRERRLVLRGEDGRRHEDGDLLAVLGRLERGPQRDLGLAVADVADDEPVHRPDELHVGLDLGRGAQLVDRLLVRERRLHLGLPRRVGRERVAPRVGARGVQREQLLGEVVDRLADALLGAQPLGPAEPRQGRSLAARVAADPADLLDRDEDPVAAGERQLEVVAILAGAAAAEHLLVAGDAVIDVDDEVARRQALEDVARDDPPEGPRPADPDRAEQLPVGDEGEAVRAADEAAVEAPIDERDGARRRRLPHPTDDRDRVAGLAQEVGQPRRLVRGEHDPGAVGTPRVDRLGQPPGPAGRQDRLAPAERVARRQRAAGHRDVLGRDRLPGQLERPRGDEAALPVTRRQVGRRPVLGQLAGLHELGASLVGLAPQELGGFGDVAGLIEDEERARIEVVERGRRGEVGGPDLGRVADREGARGRAGGGRAGRRAAGPDAWLASSRSASNRARSAASRSGRRAAARPRRSRIARRATGRQEELGRRQEHGRFDRADGPLVGRVERAKRVDLVAEELDPDRQRPSTAGRRRRSRRGVPTRRARRPR